MTTSNFILDSGFSAQESCKKEASNTLFGWRFGIKAADGSWYARPLNTLESLQMYSVNAHHVNTVPPHFNIDDIVDDLLLFSLPWGFLSEFLNEVSPVSTIMDWMSSCSANSTHSNAAQCFFSKVSTESFNWQKAYAEDPETIMVYKLLQDGPSKPTLTDEQLQTVRVSYRTALQEDHIQLVNSKLVLYKPFQMNTRCVALVIVPAASLRKKIFNHFHAGPSASHMGEYETLFRFRLRFFWPGLQGDCKAWIKGCAHCVANNEWRS